MKKIFALMLAAAVSTTAWADDNTEEKTDSVKGFVFTDTILVPTTSVKDQNKSGTCWCFASTSFFEDEVKREKGLDIDLSEMYTVRHTYIDKADKYVRMYGQHNFAAGGSLTDVPYVIRNYGVVPETVYPGLNYGEEGHDHGELDAVLSAYVKQVVEKPSKKLSTAWKRGFEGIVDAYLGEEPGTFVVDGVTYTPRTYADFLGLNPDNYVALTSFTHHPFYQPFAMEVADNWLWDQYMNIPMDELKAVIDNALENGYPVAWSADVSEPGFKWKEGFAIMPEPKDESNLEGTELARWVKLSDAERRKEQYNITGPCKEITVTQEMRQDMFDRQQTTDDHGMEIVGIATDQEGNRFYKVKNSWNTNQVYDGFIYVSEPYLLAKTLDIYVNKKAVPKAIAKKIGLK